MLESQMDINKLEYYYDDLLPLYKLYNIEKCLKDITKERVWLKSGAYLVIQPTEALVVIDVNSGKNASNKKVSNQFMKINLEAAKEIAVQIRLRNLSGIIIIDFINMKDQEDKETLLKEFDGYLKEDRLNATIIDMTKLDLVEVTRKKVRKSIYEQLKYE
jgi:ribonuclease G